MVWTCPLANNYANCIVTGVFANLVYKICNYFQESPYDMLGRSPHKNCKNDLDDQT